MRFGESLVATLRNEVYLVAYPVHAPIGGVVGLRLVATSLVILQCFAGAIGLSTIDHSVVAVFNEMLANLVHDGFETAVIGR